MFWNVDTIIKKIEYRIHLLKARGEERNLKLIRALEREKRALIYKSL